MECTVCNIRSQVDSCVQCRTLLCEVCGETCEKCGEMACPDHTKRTRSGHILCSKCYEKRRARRDARHQAEMGGGTGLEDLHGKRSPPQAEEEDEHAALTASAQTNWPPWRLSLLAAIVGLVFVVVILFFPSLRRISMGSGYLPTSLFVIFLTAISAFWAFIGLISHTPESEENRNKCLTGLALGVVAALLAVFAIVSDPAKALDEEKERVMQEQRDMSPEERREQTRDILNQF